MTKYTDADLQAGWEFKMLRANTTAFRKPEVFQKVCAEEAAAGLDVGGKVRQSTVAFQAPISARAGDAALDFDPYRTRYGMSAAKFSTLVVGCTLLGTALLIGGMVGIVSLFIPHR